jgi:hypothetical protein
MINLTEQQQIVVNKIKSNITDLNVNALKINISAEQLNSYSDDFTSLLKARIKSDIIANLTNSINNNPYSLALDNYKFYETGTLGDMNIFAIIKNNHLEPVGSDIDLIEITISVVANLSFIDKYNYEAYLSITPIVNEIQLITQ